MSETYYAGDKGDEVSDYSFNFKLGITSNIKSTSVFVYTADLKRATAASTTDAMFRSLSYKGSLLANYPTMTQDRGLLRHSDNILIGKEIMSETYYAGDKGDEVSDYSFNFKLGITSNIKSTSVFVYSADLKRATAASTTDAMFRSLSYKGSLMRTTRR